MTIQHHGQVPAPDHARIHRADEARLRHPIPALNTAVENANVTLDKVALLLNRAGSNPRNPMLAGLGLRVEMPIGSGDSPRGAWLFQDRANMGANLKEQLLTLGPGIFGLDVVLGAGLTLAGSPATGARKNFVRLQTAFGTFEREFWIKTKDADIVGLNGQPALDPITLAPVARTVSIVDATAPWLDVTIDFFMSWNDEFGLLHNAENPALDPGAAKPYGGSKFVSFFDTSTATEGVGVQVNPVTQDEVSARHKIQVQNTAGLKQITVRFRSKMDSPYLVDVPILINVVALSCPACEPPVIEPCEAVYVRAGTPIVENTPKSPSQVGVPTVYGNIGELATEDLLVVAVRGQFKASNPRVRVRTWSAMHVVERLTGIRFVPAVADVTYIPIGTVSSAAPHLPPPYSSAKIYTIALSVAALRSNNVAFIEVMLQEGDDPPAWPFNQGPAMTSHAILIPGPRARDLCFFAPGDVGGGAGCCGTGDDVADFNNSCMT